MDSKKMPDYGTELKPMKRLGGKSGLRKNAVIPTVIIKQEDRIFLKGWQAKYGVPVHIWHVFYDVAYGISLDKAEELIESGLIEASEQVFQAPGGQTTTKNIYKIYYHYAYPLGETEGKVDMLAEFILDKNGHILPYVRFHGGSLRLLPPALEILRKASALRLKAWE